MRFNPRLRVGGDTSTSATPRSRPRFNPRLRVGGDSATAFSPRTLRVSIRASAWEATNDNLMFKGDDGFQSAPPRGRRRSSSIDDTGISGFNPRLRVGGDAARLAYPTGGSWFQSAPPRGRRQS